MSSLNKSMASTLGNREKLSSKDITTTADSISAMDTAKKEYNESLETTQKKIRVDVLKAMERLSGEGTNFHWADVAKLLKISCHKTRIKYLQALIEGTTPIRADWTSLKRFSSESDEQTEEQLRTMFHTYFRKDGVPDDIMNSAIASILGKRSIETSVAMSITNT